MQRARAEAASTSRLTNSGFCAADPSNFRRARRPAWCDGVCSAGHGDAAPETRVRRGAGGAYAILAWTVFFLDHRYCDSRGGLMNPRASSRHTHTCGLHKLASSSGSEKLHRLPGTASPTPEACRALDPPMGGAPAVALTSIYC